ncbi:hypothetical protein RBSH_05587 [Rhodopirellula baltica SH28]|uniref:Uncharacterized protein n=1 Tax=Rhodopirellula baltica SH28 TaxID=993517 RepID=K5E061_RHOBT|nr:hypothetical protein RBSH_05587 [Rhodopirellula baltica SH28]
MKDSRLVPSSFPNVVWVSLRSRDQAAWVFVQSKCIVRACVAFMSRSDLSIVRQVRSDASGPKSAGFLEMNPSRKCCS